MSVPSDIGNDEIILKRLPPRDEPKTTVPRPDGGERATSFFGRNRPGEQAPSYYRLRYVGPRDVLADLERQKISKEGWMVFWLRVSDVRHLGLDVIDVPAEGIPGHCEIRETSDTKFSDKRWSQLAKKSRVLTEEEVANVPAGGTLRE